MCHKCQLVRCIKRTAMDWVNCHGAHIPVLSSMVTTVASARDLGVVVDSQLTMSANVSSTCRSAYYQLRQLRPVIRSLSVNAAKTAVQAFVSTRLDYCNSLMNGIADGRMQRLQAVQNAAARLITGARRCDHISPALRQLHWLPVRQRVQFKLAVLVLKALHGLAPQCLTDDCQLVSTAGRRQLRSSDLWNALPISLRQSDLSLGQFRRALKTHLFDYVCRA